VEELECRESAAGLEVVDTASGAQVLRLRSATTVDRSSERLVTSSVAAVGALAQSVSAAGALLAQASASGHALQVVFSPATQHLIASGTFGLMQSAKGALPMAVDQAGKIREIGRIVPAGGVVAGPALLPVLLPAAAAAAASYYQHQALQATLDEIRAVVERIESRMRDDDWAVLEAADDLAFMLVERDTGWEVPEQLRLELAVARQHVERVFRSRRRYVKQLIESIDHETAGLSNPWTDRVRGLVKGESNWIEMSLFLEAMVVRARLTSCTSMVLATEGDARAAARLARSAAEELSSSYTPIVTTLKRLAGRRPEGHLLDFLPGRKSSDEDRFRFLGALVKDIEDGVGKAVSGLDAETTVTLPAHEVKALATGLRVVA
jgi:hypothetical protein